MDIPGKTKLENLQVAHQHVETRNEYGFFFSFLIGLYSCRWKQHQRKRIDPGKCCCTKREFAFSPWLIITFCVTFIFVYLWGEAKNDYDNFDWYNYGKFGYWFFWSRVLLGIAAFFFLYILLLVILTMCLVMEGGQLYLHWSHKTGTLLILAFSIAVLCIVSRLWHEEWNTFSLSFQVTGPFLHVVALAGMVLLSWPVALHANRIKAKVLKAVILGPYLAFLIFLLFVPLGMYSPCILEEGALGPKPVLIGHRGAPMVAPENTKMSFQKAVAYGVAGLETDVTISYDGVPFLMHDKTLKRTTNIGAVSPSFMNEKANWFSWEFLQQLNAGEWFFKNKPYAEMPPLSPEDAKWARNQTIYKFSDFLKLADRENKFVIFDLYRPSIGHPYRDTWIHRILDVIINESKIKHHLVLWLENESRSYVQSVAPGFRQTMNSILPLEELQREKIVTLNLDYRKMSADDIRMYAMANITTNLYVINERWVFSLAWCSGAHSVTTNAMHILGSVQRPFFLMSPKEYMTMWILTNVLSVVIISIIFGIRRWYIKFHPSGDA